jgi:hypothetical protein
MTTQMLIYEAVVPLTAAKHRDLSLDITANYSFSAKVNSVPLMAVEFPLAMFEYAIVFAGPPENIMPAVILGLRENLYLSSSSDWQAKYKPAFVRRYPFVFSSTPDAQKFRLCIDEAFSGLNKEGRGQKLFDAGDKPTPYVDSIRKFLQDFQLQFQRTQAFCKKVQELDLLEPMQANVQTPSGEKFSLGGLMRVNRAKLKAVPGDKLAELAKTDELELIYCHIQSMQNFTNLRYRLAGRSDSAAAPPAADVSGGGSANGAM